MDHPAPGSLSGSTAPSDSLRGGLSGDLSANLSADLSADDRGETYGLEELLAVAGERLGEEITPRTVRLYATQGLIDRPGREGRSATYGGRQLLQLLLIRTLARRGLSLTAIAPLVTGSDAELRDQLLQLEDPAAAAPGLRSRLRLSAEQREALSYLEQLDCAEDDAINASDSSRSLLSLLGSPLRAHSLSQKVRRGLSARSPGRSSAATSLWHRFSLAPGVELHLSDAASIPPAGQRREAWLQRLIDRLREQLEDTPP
ncbi:MAG: MerR family transcriptional regulator [Cyanobacteriota bacterium]